MRITCINVGYGDAILIQSGGRTVLLDGGGNLPNEFTGPHRIRAADYLRARSITHLDAVILSHIHEDHVCGLEPVLECVTVGALYLPYPVQPILSGCTLTPAPGAPRSVPLYTQALNACRRILVCAAAHGVPIRTLAPGDQPPLAPDLTCTVLAPAPAAVAGYMDILSAAYAACGDAQTATALLARLDAASNDTSLLLKLETEQTALLLASDSCPRLWDHVPLSLLENVNVLKLPHHGQIDSISEQIMRYMPLTHVITTAASDRRYQSAHPAVYARLRALYAPAPGPQFLFTDERSYPPYFSQPEGFQALSLVIHSGQIQPEFIKIHTTPTEAEEER